MKEKVERGGSGVEMLRLLVGGGVVEYFEVVKDVCEESWLIFFVEEKGWIGEEDWDLDVDWKGLLGEIEVEEFGVGGKGVYVGMKGGGWEEGERGESYSGDWKLVGWGSGIRGELGGFLKGLVRE